MRLSSISMVVAGAPPYDKKNAGLTTKEGCRRPTLYPVDLIDISALQ